MVHPTPGCTHSGHPPSKKAGLSGPAPLTQTEPHEHKCRFCAAHPAVTKKRQWSRRIVCTTARSHPSPFPQLLDGLGSFRSVRSPLKTGKRSALAIFFAAVVVATTPLACSLGTQAPDQAQVVEVLWFGEQADGSLLSGTVATEVALRRIASGVDVDIEGLRQSGAGDAWVAAAWTAAMTALLTTGDVPDGVQLSMIVDESIDGPSAGGLIAVAALADLEGVSIIPKASMTGTIHPNGAIGPVGGVPEKLRAAAAKGITTVVVPASKRIAFDPRTGTEVDVAEMATDLGVTVVFVDSLVEARHVLLGGADPALALALPAVPKVFTTLYDGDAEAMAERLGALRVAPVPTGGPSAGSYRGRGLVGDQTELETILAIEQAAYDPDTSQNGFHLDYEVAAMTERLVSTWNAEMATITSVETEGLNASVVELTAAAAAVEQLATDTLVAIASTPYDSVEQLVALVDAATWATDAIATSTATAAVLQGLVDGVESTLTAARAAGAIAAARYDLQSFAPTALQAAAVPGKLPAGEDTLSRLGLLTAVVAGAHDANMAVIESSSRSGGRDFNAGNFPVLTLDAEVVDRKLGADSGDGPRLVIASAAAISQFVASSELINLDRAAQASDSLLTQLTITDPDYFATQVSVAIDLSQRSLAELSVQGASPGYLQWQAQLAEHLLIGDSPAISTSERIDGLRRLWFANIAERILVALANP